jgi:SAM-dependent methyltransferase
MDVQQCGSVEQATLWNGLAGRAWVETQDLLDRMFQPFEELLVEAVRVGRGGRVLDVGCGVGSTTLALAQASASKACTGIDISEPMIAAARERAARGQSPAQFICADAQRHAFGQAKFDSIVSRFGVMFFEDPIQAFANLRRAAGDGAALRFIAWRSAAENPFMTTAERAAAQFLPNLPARRADGPGQFAFADSLRVRTILERSGWAEIDIRPVDVVCTLPESELLRYLTRLGPLGLVLQVQEADERIRAQVVPTVRAAFDPYVRADEVRYTAACWMVSAVAE